MENAILKKRINDFLSTEKSGDGKAAGKAFKENLAKFMSDVIFDEVKQVQDSIPMKESIPEADASVMKEFKHDVGDDVYYVIFKQVRSQVKGRLQVTYGWQFAVLRGKAEEISIRNDHGVLYKVNGDWIIADLVFKTEKEACARCNQMNAGTDSFAVDKAIGDEPVIEKCCVCGCDVDLRGDWCQVGEPYPGEPEPSIMCKSCWEKEQEMNATPPQHPIETSKGGKVDGKQEEGRKSSDDTGRAQVGSDSTGESDAARDGAV